MGHTGILMGMNLGIRVVDAVVSVILARYLMPEGFGLLAFAVSFGALFSIIPGAGMGYLVTRDVAKDPARIGRHLSDGLTAKLFLCLLTLALMWAAAALFGFPARKIQIVMIGALLMMAETVLRFILSFFQGLRRMWTVAIANLSVRLGWLVLSLSVVALHGDLFALLWVRVLVTAAGMLGSLWLLHARVERIRWGFDPKASVKMVISSFPFALFRLRGAIYADLDTVMLSMLAGDLLTGWYASARKVLRVFEFIPTSFSGALLPTLSKTVQERPKDAAWTLNRSCRYLLVIGLPVAAGISVLAPGFIAALYGPGYEGAAGALRILILSVPFAFLNGSLLAGMGAVNEEKKGSKILVGGLLFSGLSNFVVIPLFGHLGAASTTLLAEISIFLLQARLLRKVLPGFKIMDVKPGLWAAALAMAVCAWGLRGFNWAAALAASSGLYLSLIFLLGVVTRNDMDVLRKIFRRKQAAVVEAEEEAQE